MRASVGFNVGPFRISQNLGPLLHLFMTLCTGGLWLLVWRPWRRR